MMFMIALTGFAHAAPAPLIASATPVSEPSGIRAEWALEDDCHPTVRIYNSRAAPVNVDWMHSAVAVNGEAVGVLPGSAPIVMLPMIPPQMIPPGAFITEILLRKGPDTACLLQPYSTLVFTISIGEEWLSAKITTSPDLDAARRIEEERKAAIQRELEEMAAEARRQEEIRIAVAQVAYEKCKAAREVAIQRAPRQRAAAWITGGLVAAGGATLAIGREPGTSPAAGVMVMGIGSALWAGIYFNAPEIPECIEPV